MRLVLSSLSCSCFAVLGLCCSLSAQPADLAMKSRHAKELMAAGKFEESIPIYRELVRALPNNPGLIMDLGIALHMAGHEQQAVRQFQTVLRLDPQHLPARLFLGEAYLALGEPAKAIEPLEKVVRAQPDNQDAQEALGQALLSLERFAEAAGHFEKLTELDSRNPRAWNGLGLCYEALAQRNFDELGRAAPGSGYWLGLVAENRLKAPQYSSAFFLYRQALAKQPAMRGAHAAIAEIYRNTGHADWAAIEEEKERTLSPPNCSSVDEKSECDFLAGRYRDLVAAAGPEKTAESYYWRSRAYNRLAFEAFSQLGRLPPSPEMHELMAKIHWKRRQYLESANEWRQALNLSPDDPRIQQQLAVALNLSGDHETARQLLAGLLRRKPNSAELNYLFGETLLFMKRADQAVPFLMKAVKLDPKLLVAHRTLADAYVQLGEAPRALPHLKAALPIDDDGSLHYQLARAYQSSGQQTLAKKMLKDYQDIRKSIAAENQAAEEEVQITPP